jgi:release factor glutamine methyltransferase
VQAVLDWAAGREALAALDVGTGSGAIALALASEGPFARVLAVDVSAGALEVARANAREAATAAPVELRLGSLYEAAAGERFDVVVSNPPYVGEDERVSLDAEVRDWEPGQALFAGAGGLEVIRPLVEQAPAHLRPGGLLAMEIGAGQAAAVRELIRATAAFAEPRVKADLAGRDRIVTAELRQD